ncbi:hypothetical protein CAP35_01350 [Chitinophagaceae bacterium IBVUCB1]|nr:hypothetical protein CAP35_01350 [Chitinophagaceae bacterium IBVUCB1]
MKVFDLKKFRGGTGLNQEAFAKRIQRSQTTVCRIEKGEKAISDKFLDAISKGFSIDLEIYKSYNQSAQDASNHSGKITDSQFASNYLYHKHDISDLEQRYILLLEEKKRIENEHHELYKKMQSLEPALVAENNELLKKLTSQNELILTLLNGKD